MVTRRPPPLAVPAADLASRDQLIALRDRDHPGRRILAADLSLGSGRAHQLARDLHAQLGLDEPDTGRDGRHPSIGYAELISAGIDAEARGRAPILHAIAAADRILAALAAGPPALLVVVAPRFGAGWAEEDDWLLRFLACGLADDSSLLIVAPDEAAFPAWLAPQWRDPPAAAAGPEPAEPFLVPGICTPRIAELVGAPASALDLPGGCLLAAPAARRPPASLSAEHDALAARSAGEPWLNAYAQLHGSNYFVDPQALAAEAWRQFAAGGVDSAVRLLGRARDCAKGRADRAQLEAQLQGMRIASHRFAEAAEAADPNPSAPPPLRAFLEQAKGWGAVMSGRFEEGRDRLEKALALEGETGISHLYLLNILALAHARTGRPEEALRLEDEIRAANASAAEPDHRLGYVNCINSARLHRMGGRLGRARELYCEAFATNEGGRSETDLIYRNACLARLAEDEGDRPAAFAFWLRAALHFAAAGAPEAIGDRHAAAMLDRGSAGDDQPERIASFLRERLGETGGPEARRCAQGRDGSPAPVFAFAEQEDPASLSGVGAAGWGLLHLRGDRRPAYDGPAHRALRHCLDRLIRTLCPGAAPTGGAWLVDERFGREMPVDERELTGLCVRRGVARAWYEGAPLALEDSAERVETASIVRPGDLVAVIDLEGGDYIVRFKRQRPPARLSDAHVWIEAATRRRPVGDVLAALPAAERRQARAQLRALERDRILVLDEPEPAEPAVAAMEGAA